jgi:ectoine hydroxylase-related dioxygenase (phytanoyl-CoA dioxygenase family)
MFKLWSNRLELLSPSQRSTFVDEGFILLPCLIERKIVERASNTQLNLVRNHVAPVDHRFSNHADLLACFTHDVRNAAAELLGARKELKAPSVAYTMSVFPVQGPWTWPSPHIDHANKEDSHQTFPAPFRVGCIIYLTDSPAHSGGTVLWPGSQRRLEALAREDPERYRYLWEVNRDLRKVCTNSPVEMTPQAGDVLFYHYLCAHAGSLNTGDHPRLALNHKW